MAEESRLPHATPIPELLREEIAHTVAGPEEIDDEIRSLFATLAS